MGRKSSIGDTVVIGFMIIVAAIAALPREIWVLIAVVIVSYFLLKVFAPNKSPSNTSTVENSPAPTHSSDHVASLTSTATFRSGTNEPVPIFEPQRSHTESYRIPESANQEKQSAHWIVPGESIQVGGFTLPCGMLYVGSGLRSLNEGIEPALINPKLAITPNVVDESLRLTDYWPSYDRLHPEARRAYLQWLAGGRNTPDANIGYVFLFFYGLERRALVDAQDDSDARADTPAVTNEVRRLLTLYGSNGSFRSYATNFLQLLDLSTSSVRDSLYQQAPPQVEPGYELPLQMRLGLGQMAFNKIPVPVTWAHAWVLADPNITRRTPVTRCVEIFKTLFNTKYSDKFGDGMRLAVNRTRLKCSYRAASSGMAGKSFSVELFCNH
jgi:hypothetical protein